MENVAAQDHVEGPAEGVFQEVMAAEDDPPLQAFDDPVAVPFLREVGLEDLGRNPLQLMFPVKAAAEPAAKLLHQCQ